MSARFGSPRVTWPGPARRSGRIPLRTGESSMSAPSGLRRRSCPGVECRAARLTAVGYCMSALQRLRSRPLWPVHRRPRIRRATVRVHVRAHRPADTFVPRGDSARSGPRMSPSACSLSTAPRSFAVAGSAGGLAPVRRASLCARLCPSGARRGRASIRGCSACLSSNREGTPTECMRSVHRHPLLHTRSVRLRMLSSRNACAPSPRLGPSSTSAQNAVEDCQRNTRVWVEWAPPDVRHPRGYDLRDDSLRAARAAGRWASGRR